MDNTAEELKARLEAAKQMAGKRRLYVADSPAGSLILGAPSKVAYRAYRTMLLSEEASDKERAADTLLIACAVDPDPMQMKALLDDYVALAGSPEVASAIAKAIGTARADDEKK